MRFLVLLETKFKKIKSINLERRKRIKFLENNLDKKSIFIICKPKNMKQYSPFF